MRDSLRKYLAAATLLVLPIIAACGEDVMPPPPTGSIVGQVSIEGMGIDGVSVSLSNGASTATAGGGNYRFDSVEQGSYTVTISGFPADASFDQTSAPASIGDTGGTVTVDFRGTYIRTAAIMGTVTVENMGLGGVAVRLSGAADSETMTDDSGQYSFTGLRAGTYQVEISGFNTSEVSFSSTSGAATVGVGESKVVSFDGTYLRTAGIIGTVTVEGEGLANVTVSLTGGPDGNDETTMTDAAGQYSFSQLRAGEYAVGISGYDTDDYEFVTTSKSVTIAVGETANVPFDGILLRTAGISGRVSVEGTGLADVTVTLSMADADDMTTMTDAGGQYAFAGLAAGDYTVSIALSAEQMVAFVFDSTSEDVTVADDETAIVNFDAEHAATASVTVRLFVDEGPKNDMMDEGEMMFPTPEMLAVVAELGLPLALPISLSGPGVHDMHTGMAMPDGSVVFGGLKAGGYQVIVTDIPDEVLAALPPALGNALRDYAYGGPATGYPIAVGVGQDAMQYAPVDITHQTVHFSTWLKHGDMTGDALAGATVTLYADEDGTDMVGSGMTDDMGVTSIRFERADTEGNMVYAGIEAPEGDFAVSADGKQAVMWNPMYPTGDVVTNTADIVNLKAEVSFGGQTITTAMGGGEALAGWAIDVTMMGEDGKVAVEGAPTMLDDEGMGTLMMMAGSIDDLPMTYYVNPAADQDDEMDGSESYEAVDEVMHTHTGLSMGTEMDAGMMTVRFTTQTLVVSVYHELDQVPGYTGNIGTKDASATCIARDDDDDCVTGVELELRHETPSNRRGTIDPKVWRWEERNVSGRTVWISRGVYTFRHLPTDHNIFVLADEIGHVEVVHSDNLAAYENADDNGIMGSAFGAEGGFGHTVKLCPLMKVDPTGQDFGECGSFGFVSKHVVSAHVKKMIVETDNNDGFKAERAINVTGVEVGLMPVTGQNIAGDAASITTLKNQVRSAGETSSSSTWDDDIDERQDLYFGRTPEGVYNVSVSDKWSTTVNGAAVGKEFRLDADDLIDVTDPALTGLDGPFRPSDTEGVYIEVRPKTSTLYGVILDAFDDPVEDVEVTVNGVTVQTDIDGRYIAPDFSRMTSRASPRAGSKLYITVAKAGYKTQTDDPNNSRSSRRYQIEDADGAKDGIDFTTNDPQRLDITLIESDLVATITGTVTDKNGDPVAGVDITVTNEAGEDRLNNWQWLSGIGYCQTDGRRVEGVGDVIDADLYCRRTGEDGTYELQVLVTEDDADYTITPSKNRYYFDDPYEIERVESGDTEEDLNFEALKQSRIRGAVKTDDDSGVGGVKVMATAQGRVPAYMPYDETNSNGRFTIWVDGDERYDITASKDDYSFENPEDADGLRVDDDETHDIGTFVASSVPSNVATLSGLTVTPGVMDPATFDPMTKAYTAKVGYTTTSTRVTATATSSAATITITAGETTETGTGSAMADVELEVGNTTVTIAVESQDESTTEIYTLTVTREANQPTAPRNLKAVSAASQTLTVTWEPPVNIASLTGYEWSATGDDGSWAPANAGGTAITITGAGGSLTLEAGDGLQNGLDQDIHVRAFSDPDGTRGNADDVVGAAASITAAPWPAITTVAAASTTISESAAASPTGPTETDTTTVTITVGAVAYEDFDVMLAVADEEQAGLLTFEGRATVRRGQTTAEVLVTAVDNVNDASAADPTVTDPVVLLNATMVPAEAADRDAVATGTGVTITDDDVAPTAPTAFAATQVGTTSTFEVTWTFLATQWGTSDVGRKFQYRVKNAAFTDTAADNALWTDVSGGTTVRAVNVTLEAPATGTVTYNIEVRAVTEAGNGAALAGTQDRAAS
ncbi:MAG: carboxypeptidase regulatory-like domain-containing protein [Gemmatimonadota bacterium]|nr:carboxypeptidase regulatory-like domain-containing protein [Gemmatimonadota bacterium]